MSYWNYLVLLLSVLTGTWLIVSATRRTNRANLTARIITSVVAVIALALMAFKFYYKSVMDQSSNDEIVIVTAGTIPDSLDSFTSRGIPIFSFDEKIANDKNYKAKLLRSPGEIASTGIIHITGFGLGEAQLKSLEKNTLRFHPSTPVNNFESISWPQYLNSGDEFIIQGQFNNHSKQPYKLILEGFGTHLDSAVIAAGGSSGFSLSTVPKQRGRAIYTLIVSSGEKIISQEKIPVELVPADPLKILVLSASPDFENKFLKNWLFTRNYGIAVRSTISKNKFSGELLNIENLNTANINPGLLNNFDLVIGDATALAALPVSQQSSLRNAVEQQGLGLIIKADSITKGSYFYNQLFKLTQSPVVNKQQISLQLWDSTQALPGLIIERPMHISATERIRPILHDKDGHLFAASTIWGNGKLLYTTINNSYSWVLAGDSIGYRQLWSNLVSEVARKKTNTEQYISSPALPLVDMPATISIESQDSLPFMTTINNIGLPLKQDFNLPFNWEGNYWPRKGGWQHAQKRDNQYFSWYVFSDNDWKDIRAINKIRLNEFYSTGVEQPAKKILDSPLTSSKELSKIYFLVIFIICCTYLWIEEKFYNRRL